MWIVLKWCKSVRLESRKYELWTQLKDKFRVFYGCLHSGTWICVAAAMLQPSALAWASNAFCNQCSISEMPRTLCHSRGGMVVVNCDSWLYKFLRLCINVLFASLASLSFVSFLYICTHTFEWHTQWRSFDITDTRHTYRITICKKTLLLIILVFAIRYRF